MQRLTSEPWSMRNRRRAARSSIKPRRVRKAPPAGPQSRSPGEGRTVAGGGSRLPVQQLIQEEAMQVRGNARSRRDRIDHQRIYKLLESGGLDGAVCLSGKNVVYLAGVRLPGTLGRLQDFPFSPRPCIVVWPRTGDPILVVPQMSEPFHRRHSWIADIRPYQEYAAQPYEALASVLESAGLGSGCLGMDLEAVSERQIGELRRRLPRAAWIDLSDALDAIRSVKTPAETEIIEQSGRLQDEAFLEVFASAREGDTERELHARMVAGCLRRGAEFAHGLMQFGRNPVLYGGEGDTRLHRGDIIRTDYVSYLEGYPANLSRVAVLGPPSQEQREMYTMLFDIHQVTLRTKLWAGVPANQVYQFVADQFASYGLKLEAALVGHSLGIWFHQEEPVLAPSETAVLQAGMVICLEPALGHWHLQDEILVTDGQPRLLSKEFDTSEIFAMG